MFAIVLPIRSRVPVLVVFLAGCASDPLGTSKGGDSAAPDAVQGGDIPVAELAHGTTATSGICAGVPRCSPLDEMIRWTAPAGWKPGVAVLGDVTADGHLDSTIWDGGAIRIVPGPLRVAKDLAVDSFVLVGSRAVSPAGDANQDGVDDLWVNACLPGEEGDCSAVSWVLVPGPITTASLDDTRATAAYVAFTSSDSTVFPGDVNGDGWMDVVTFNARASAELLVFRGPLLDGTWNGEPTARFAPCDVEGDWTFGDTQTPIDVGHDRTGDGIPDIVVETGADECAGGLVIDGSATGDLTVDSPGVRVLPGDGAVFVGDISGDGLADFNGLAGEVSTLFEGPLTFDAASISSKTIGLLSSVPGTPLMRDLTGDGLHDTLDAGGEYSGTGVVDYRLHPGTSDGFAAAPHWMWRSDLEGEFGATNALRGIYTEDGVSGILAYMGSDTFLLELP